MTPLTRNVLLVAFAAALVFQAHGFELSHEGEVSGAACSVFLLSAQVCMHACPTPLPICRGAKEQMDK